MGDKNENNNLNAEKNLLELIDSVNFKDIKEIDVVKISSNEGINNYLILSKFNQVTIKKFIKFGIQFIEYMHEILVNHLKTHDSKIISSDLLIIKSMQALFSIIKSIVSCSDKSIEFCNNFHQEESINGIKVLFEFLLDEYLFSTLVETELITGVHDLIICSLLNLSKAYENNKEKWEDLQAFPALLNLIKKTKNKELVLILLMTISNIATDEDLNSINLAPQVLLELTDRIDMFADALANKLYESSDKKFLREKFQIEEDQEKVEIIVSKHEGSNLFECLHALYKFLINDKLKTTICEMFEVKASLKKIIYNGNEAEKEIAFKVLNQLCFDKSICQEISNDQELLKYMNEIILPTSSSNSGAKSNLTKNIKSVLWLITKKESDENKTKYAENDPDRSKHVFISYNSESRPICLKIKIFLESSGFKCWIDVENIHGSSIDAMASGIEASSCVLICMTEKYKESNNCRMEAEYVMQKKKPFVPLILQKSYKPDGWFVYLISKDFFELT